MPKPGDSYTYVHGDPDDPPTPDLRQVQVDDRTILDVRPDGSIQGIEHLGGPRWPTTFAVSVVRMLRLARVPDATPAPEAPPATGVDTGTGAAGTGGSDDAGAAERPDFLRELTALINRHSLDRGSNTPDHILAKALDLVLMVIHQAIRDRDTWYGVTLAPGRAERGETAAQEAGRRAALTELIDLLENKAATARRMAATAEHHTDASRHHARADGYDIAIVHARELIGAVPGESL